MVKEKEIKLHIGCGTVYLEGYINIHPAPDGLAGFYPEEVKRNKTTIANYYTKPIDNRPKFHVADVRASLDDLLEVLPESWIGNIDEICMFHVLEHIPKYEVDEKLKFINKLLSENGRFRVAVPDTDGFVLEFAEKLKSGISEEEKEWYYRCIYGTQKDKWSHHYCGYNKYRLSKLLTDNGFSKIIELPNQNFYPSIHLLAAKESNMDYYINDWLEGKI